MGTKNHLMSLSLIKQPEIAMSLQVNKNSQNRITYSCYFNKSREGEQFVPEHIFSYQIAGTLTLYDGTQEYIFKDGDFRFIKRNNLLKFTKQPPAAGEFKSISIYLDQETLRKISIEYNYSVNHIHDGDSILKLEAHQMFKSYLESLEPYDTLNERGSDELVALKLKEAILILIKTNPELKDILFDFSEPGKIDLEAFMNKNYHFNVTLNHFAYLTGRSLATFKRDFEKIFRTSPSRWLLQRRLKEAYYQIKEKGKKPSEVYLEVGFEDLSHFSFAFKNAFGHAPTKV
ncbi:helix-turn-helix domain-containing protein [Ohtaekwangia kribbensis]